LPVTAAHAGVIDLIDCRGLGLAVVELGGGRRRPDDSIDYAVGLTDLAELGRRVEAGQPIALIHARDSQAALSAAKAVQSAYKIGATAATLPPSVYSHID